MANPKPWARRPVEEANLFNPAFLCGLTYEFTKAYSKEIKAGAPLMLVVIALTASLHSQSRERLPHSTVGYLYGWLQEHESLLVEFAERARNLTPYIKQAIMFGIAAGALEINGHHLTLGRAKASFTKSLLDDLTHETRNIIDSSKFLGRWFAKSGSEVSIAAAWGVKP